MNQWDIHSHLTYLSYTQIDGSQSKEAVFKEIESLLSQLQQDKVKIIESGGMKLQGCISNSPFIYLFVGNCKIWSLYSFKMVFYFWFYFSQIIA